MSEEPRQDITEEIDQEMSDHVCDEVAAPKVGCREDGAKRKGGDDVAPSTCPVGNGEDGPGNRRPQIAIQFHGLDSLDRVAAIKYVSHAYHPRRMRDKSQSVR